MYDTFIFSYEGIHNYNISWFLNPNLKYFTQPRVVYKPSIIYG